MDKVLASRVRRLNDRPMGTGPVLLWLSRDFRVRDNWSFHVAGQLARQQGAPLIVITTLIPGYLGATLRQFQFLIEGLKELEADCRAAGVGYRLVPTDDPAAEIARQAADCSAVVSDFMPLRVLQGWRTDAAEKLAVPLLQVDSHTVVPPWTASPKKEWSAATFRPKLLRLLPEYLTEFPELPATEAVALEPADWTAAYASLRLDRTVTLPDWAVPGPKEGERRLVEFVRDRLDGYAERRNDAADPGGQSQLSPWLHFGHLSAQRAALAVRASSASEHDKDRFLDELLVRRELSENFCFYEPRYDELAGAPQWARTSLAAHAADPRPAVYTVEQLERAETDDELWNAAQTEMVRRGKMHGYLRMFWAKRILEWSTDAEEAVKKTIALNDKYFLDGREPAGYSNILWSIAGLHDRPWFEREIFGQVRYMNSNGSRRKFDVPAYIAWVNGLPE